MSKTTARSERSAAQAWLVEPNKTGAGAVQAIKAMGYTHTRSTAKEDVARADYLAMEIAGVCGVCGSPFHDGPGGLFSPADGGVERCYAFVGPTEGEGSPERIFNDGCGDMTCPACYVQDDISLAGSPCRTWGGSR